MASARRGFPDLGNDAADSESEGDNSQGEEADLRDGFADSGNEFPYSENDFPSGEMIFPVPFSALATGAGRGASGRKRGF
ncbi:MAG: hypothetical protein FJ388_00530 [Verrucomicrobia bacterium]|nr:hypothetical protein [Verrucomicrobiota bacterium]